MQDIMVALGLVLTAAGSGGFAKPASAQTNSPSSSEIYVHTLRAAVVPGVSYHANNDGLAISAPERIAEIRNNLSLNIKQLADSTLVGRPAVYAWMDGISTPREAQQVRLKDLYDIAREWGALSSGPVGKYLIAPLTDGVSLLALLRAPVLDRRRIEAALKTIHSSATLADARKQATGYRSAASIMKARGIKPASREVQQQRIDDAVDLG